MKATERFYPYIKKGKTNLRGFKGKTGIYIIYERGKMVYIGHSTTDLYKTISRHFQSWIDFRQVRAVYPQSKQIKVRILLTAPQKAIRLEKKLIAKYQPRDCSIKYDSIKPYDGNIMDEVSDFVPVPKYEEIDVPF